MLLGAAGQDDQRIVNVSTVRPIFVLCIVALTGCGRGDHPTASATKPAATEVQALPSATTLPAPTLAASDHPVILIYLDTGFLNNPDRPPSRLDVAVWGDGRIVWDANGSPLQARIDAKQLDALLQRLHRDGVFGEGKTYYASWGPDSAFEVIDVRLPDRRLELHSWHELFEKNSELVVTSEGVGSLDGRDRDAVLAAEPQEYQRFRRVWSDIRSTVKSWIPAQGEPFTGTVALGRDG